MNNSLDNLRSTEEEWKQLLNGNFRNITEIVKPDEIASWLRQEKVINNFDYEDVTKHINNSRTNCGKYTETFFVFELFFLFKKNNRKIN